MLFPWAYYIVIVVFSPWSYYDIYLKTGSDGIGWFQGQEAQVADHPHLFFVQVQRAQHLCVFRQKTIADSRVLDWHF